MRVGEEEVGGGGTGEGEGEQGGVIGQSDGSAHGGAREEDGVGEAAWDRIPARPPLVQSQAHSQAAVHSQPPVHSQQFAVKEEKE